MLNLYSNTRKDGIFMNRRANSSYFHEAVYLAIFENMRYIGMPFLRAQIMHAVYWYIAGIFRKHEVYWYTGPPK